MESIEAVDVRRRLSTEYHRLTQLLSRNRTEVEAIRTENTEDEGDLARISHNKDVLCNLQEADLTRMRLIENAIEALDRGQYGECARCGAEINGKRLLAMPWAAFCIGCQEETEAEERAGRSSPLAGAEDGME